jgi:type IV pilus assembly protein PilW
MSAMVRRHKGFSLIEMMVGLLVGLIVTIVIFQVFEVSERQKRTTTGASDVHGNGAIAMGILGQSIRAAGAGLDHQTFSECATIRAYMGGSADASPSDKLASSLFSVVSIEDGGDDGAPDSITILSYLPNGTNSDSRYASTPLVQDMTWPNASPIYTSAARNCGTLTGPTTLASAPAIMIYGNDCMLITVTNFAPPCNGESATGFPRCDLALMSARIEKAPGGNADPNFNFPAGGSSLAPPAGFPFLKNKTWLQCFQGLYRTTYSIDNQQQLQVAESALTIGNAFVSAPTAAVMPNIVNLKAQYGYIDSASPASGIQWTNATGKWASVSGASSLGIAAAGDLADIRQIVAVRIAILARNDEYQKPDASGTCNASTDDNLKGSWLTFESSVMADNWACYRYKVFESTIPVRNLLWVVHK